MQKRVSGKCILAHHNPSNGEGVTGKSSIFPWLQKLLWMYRFADSLLAPTNMLKWCLLPCPTPIPITRTLKRLVAIDANLPWVTEGHLLCPCGVQFVKTWNKRTVHGSCCWWKEDEWQECKDPLKWQWSLKTPKETGYIRHGTPSLSTTYKNPH